MSVSFLGIFTKYFPFITSKELLVKWTYLRFNIILQIMLFYIFIYLYLSAALSRFAWILRDIKHTLHYITLHLTRNTVLSSSWRNYPATFGTQSEL